MIRYFMFTTLDGHTQDMNGNASDRDIVLGIFSGNTPEEAWENNKDVMAEDFEFYSVGYIEVLGDEIIYDEYFVRDDIAEEEDYEDYKE